MLTLTSDELLTTTRAVRKRLDLQRPVERQVVEECLQIAFQAPSGSNRQLWKWIVVDDPKLRVAMADIWREGSKDLAAAAVGAPSLPKVERADEMMSSVRYLNEHLHDVPMLLVPTIQGRPQIESMFQQSTLWGSILPAVWSFMLALRARGLGSCWTTVHLEREAQMAELLKIPADYTQAGLFPIAYTVGTDFKPGAREASRSSISWNSF